MDTPFNLNGGFKPTVKRFADLDGPDFYPTPAWATHALIHNEQFEGTIREPACGDGSMGEVLKLTGNTVVSSDLVDHGCGEGGDDFLNSTRGAGSDEDAPAEMGEGRGLVLGGVETKPVRPMPQLANAFQRVGRERNGL